MPQWPRGVSGNPAGKRRGPHHGPATLRKLAIPYRKEVVAGLLALAKTAEDERVRLAAWIELANRSDGKSKEGEDSDEEQTIPAADQEALAASALRKIALRDEAARLKTVEPREGNGNGHAS